MRHFAIRFHTGNEKPTIELTNIQLFNGSENILVGGVSNSTTNSVATGSSSAYAFDGNDITKYVALIKESRLTYTVKNDFVGTLTKLIIGNSDTYGAECPTAFDLQYSATGNPDNDSEWITIQSFVGLTWKMNEIKQFDLNAIIPVDPAITVAIADKFRLNALKQRVKTGYRPTDDEAVFLMLGDSKLTASVMSSLDVGARYDNLRELGIGDADSLRILALYNVHIDTGKYKSEQTMSLLSDPLVLNQFKLFLESRNLSLPPFDSYLVDIRANTEVYSAARDFIPT